MFEKIKEMKLAVGLGLVALILISGFVWNYFHKDKVIDNLKTTVVEQKLETAGLKTQVQDQKATAEINEAVSVQVLKDAQTLREQGHTIQTKTDKKVAAIEKTYNALPETTENVAAKETATSQAIADGMWDTYCTVKPDAPDCTRATKIKEQPL